MPGIAVDQVVDILDRLETQSIKVDPDMCSRQRHRCSSCTCCIDVCPVKAITWEDGLQVDWEACTGCGLCATVCPTGALEAQSPSDVELLAQVQEVVKEQGRVAFACPRYLETCEGNGFVSVNCLGRLDESILLGAVSLGAESVWLMDGACKGCPHAAGREIAGVVVSRTKKLLEARGAAQPVVLSAGPPPALQTDDGSSARGDALSRRGFFKMLARETVRLGQVTAESLLDNRDAEAEHEVKRGELPAKLPLKRRLLLNALRCIGRAENAAPAVDDGGLWARIGFTGDCTGCQMCAFFCPTGALSKVEREGKVGVAFCVAQCVNCGLCRDICYRDAVTLSDQVELDKVLGDSLEIWLMREASAAPWQASAEDKIAENIIELLK